MGKIGGNITKEERTKRVRERWARVVELKDKYGLSSSVVAQRLGMSAISVRQIYRNHKED